ncbi:MAG: hypothetical protein ABIJ61_12395 [bacterium]
MDRRFFLKSAVTTCGVLVVGLPNLSAQPLATVAKVDTSNRVAQLHYQGNPRCGCATPGHRRNQHDCFPQDPHKLNL